MNTSRVAPLLFLVAAIEVLSARPCAAAEEIWEYSPYRIEVWLALDDHPVLTERLESTLVRQIKQQAHISVGAPWSLAITRPVDAIRYEMLRDMERVGVDDIDAVAPEILEKDKLFLVSIDYSTRGFHVAVRELDGRTRTWSPTFASYAQSNVLVPLTVFDNMRKAFRAVTRIESSRNKDATVRPRGGGLVLSENSPAYVGVGDTLLPIIRRNDRYGKPLNNGIKTAPWTFLQATTRDGAVLICDLHSGMRGVLSGRTSSRTQKLALRVRPVHEHTRLICETRPTPDEPSRPLPGYDIYAKDIETEKLELIGRTDWRGVIDIPQLPKVLGLIYVKNGAQPLARLPMVPGLETELTAQVADDDIRLQAEGYISGIQSRMLDIVASRALVNTRVDDRIEANDLEGAQYWVEQFRSIDTRTDLNALLSQQRSQLINRNPDRRTATKIDQLYGDTQNMIAEYIDDQMADELSAKVKAAKRNPRPASPPEPEPAPPATPTPTPTPTEESTAAPAA